MSAPSVSPAAALAATDAAWRDLHRAACAPYRRAGRFAWYSARGKLGHDPVFRGLLQHGALPAKARVLDIGCGPALLASLLQGCSELQARGAWPPAWPGRPSALSYVGIELLPRTVARAQAALGPLALAPRVLQADLRDAPLPDCDVAVLLDVLHYVDPAAQLGLLRRVRAALLGGSGRRLLLRISDSAQPHRFRLTQWIDRGVIGLRGRRLRPTWGRPLAEWIALLQGLDFHVETLPMSQGTPFANVLLVCDLSPQP